MTKGLILLVLLFLSSIANSQNFFEQLARPVTDTWENLVKASEKAVQDARKATEKALHDATKTVGKAGKDLTNETKRIGPHASDLKTALVDYMKNSVVSQVESVKDATTRINEGKFVDALFHLSLSNL